MTREPSRWRRIPAYYTRRRHFQTRISLYSAGSDEVNSLRGASQSSFHTGSAESMLEAPGAEGHCCLPAPESFATGKVLAEPNSASSA